MAAAERFITVEGVALRVPRYVTRTVCGWQARVPSVESRHFPDSAYGSARAAMDAAAAVVPDLLRTRARRGGN